MNDGARRAKACELLGISVRTLYRWNAGTELADQRRGPQGKPQNALSDQEKGLITAVANSPAFRDLSPAQIVPILADSGVYLASEATFYRVLREGKLLAHRGRSRPRRHSRPASLQAQGPNQVWMWDITYLRSSVRGRFYYLYLVVDLWSRRIMGWEVHEEESAQLASELITKACWAHEVQRDQLVLHSDNGGPMKGATMLATLQWLGVVPSFSRPHVSDDNAYVEALMRTLKYRPEYPPTPFDSLEQAREWMTGFQRWYNREHLHSAIRFVTPDSRHTGKDREILIRRKEVYEAAHKLRPSRWSRGVTRNWQPIEVVELNARHHPQTAALERESA